MEVRRAVVFGPWSHALDRDLVWFHAGLPQRCARTPIERVVHGASWYLRFECDLPKQAMTLEVASQCGTLHDPEVDRFLLERADGVLFVIDSAVPNEHALLAQHALLLEIAPPAVVYQRDDAGYTSCDTPVRSADELRALLALREPLLETKASHGVGVMEAFAALVRAMIG